MISVCIPTYNGEAFIKQQLDSILNQSLAVDEIIISDDSSTDRTIEIINSYRDSRIKLFENQTFKSPIFNLENALKHAKGDFVFLSDQDDVWYPEKVKLVMAHLEKNNLVVTDCNIIDSNNKIIKPSFFDIVKSQNGFFRNLYKNGFLGCCMAFDRKLLKIVLPFPKNIAMHDIWIGLNAELLSSVYFLRDPLVGYRKHANNRTPYTGSSSKNSLFYRIKYRLEMLYLVFNNYLQKK